MPDTKVETVSKRPADTVEYLIARRKARQRAHREDPGERQDLICLACGLPYRYNADDERDSWLVCLDCATVPTEAEERAEADRLEEERSRRMARR